MSDEQRKYPPLTQHYVDVAEYIADLEERAGVPRPCPRCGNEVYPKHDALLGWEAACSQYPRCRYETRGYVAIAETWREHERNCQAAEEGEG